MEKRITFRFYKLSRHAKARVSVSDALTEIANIGGPADRERQLGTDFYARAEVITPIRGAIVGEMTRIQKTNLPSEIDGDARRPLRSGNPLGHSVVFRYLPVSGDLGIQYDPRVLSPRRFLQYVGSMVDHALFEYAPIVREDMWERFREAPVRKLSIRVAQPSHIDAVEKGPAASAASSFKSMAEAYSAPNISIELSMGTKKGALADSVKGVVRHFRQKIIRDQADVSRMKAKITGEDGTEEIDLLEDILSVKEDLPLKDNDPDANYEVKIEALRKAMNDFIS